MAITARVIADSLAENGSRLTTLEVVMPRIILAEMNTHRMFSRNSASSRAIPVERIIDQVLEDPFIPVFWGSNQPGMQAHHEMDLDDRMVAVGQWLRARDFAVGQAKELSASGVHKQITNRLLEPFMWHTVVITATEWSNFFALRKPPGVEVDPEFPAQPEMQATAIVMWQAMMDSDPVMTPFGEWHLPYVDIALIFDAVGQQHKAWEVARYVSVARCARVSYLRQNDSKALGEDIDLYQRLLVAGHMSPFEHVATPDEKFTRSGNFIGWQQLRQTIPHQEDFSKRRAKKK